MYIFGEISDTFPEIGGLIERARSLRAAMRDYPIERILNLLDAASARWSDPGFAPRREAMASLPKRIGFSSEMVEQGILTLADLLKRKNLLTRLDSDLGNPRYLDGWTYHPEFKGFYAAQPIGVVAHISAGNVFVGGVDSLIQGIVTKNVNLMKLSSVDPIFPVLFARDLREHDADGVVSSALALLEWKGGDAAVEGPLKQGVDAIVVYGGKQTIESYRSGHGLHTRLIEYGPKYSLMLLENTANPELFRIVARDVIMWEQSACSSPHTIYLEGTEEDARAFSTKLSEALSDWQKELPQAPLSPDELVEVLKVRELARCRRAMAQGDYFIETKNGRDGHWTVILDPSPGFQVSCLRRTIFVKPVRTLEEAVTSLAPMGQYIQTVAIEAPLLRTQQLGRAMVNLGADRIVDIGQMAVRKHGTPHDGTMGLAQLVRWVSLGRNVAHFDPLDYSGEAYRSADVLSRFAGLVDYARTHSPYYRETLGSHPIRDWNDVVRLPILTQSELKDHLPPTGTGLLTADPTGAWVFSSGGTTGNPKVVYRTIEEQRFNASRLGKGLALSLFRPTDRVANLLFAGNLWASFVSFGMALEEVGCQILPIAGNQPIENIVQYLRVFKATGAITIPSVMISIAEYVEANGITDIALERISVGGEHLYGEAREYLKKVLKAEIIGSTGYASNDTGAIAFQCEHCTGGVHHIHYDLHHVEIVDPETGVPLPLGEAGRVIVTNLHRRLMPVIRYDLGDMGRFLPGQCECGRTGARFELLGRSDDALIIGGGNIYPDMVSSVIHEFPVLSHHFQLVAEAHGLLDQLTVIIELMPGAEPPAGLEESVTATIYEKSSALKTMLEDRLIHPVVVKIEREGTLPRNPRTGKIKATEDRRHAR